MSSMFSASRRKSSSSLMVSANSSTSAGGLASAATGMRPTRCGASHAMARRSARTSSCTCGRCTLTTTVSPVRRRAAWTWAIDAAASGRRSNHSKVASSVAPRSASTTWRTVANDSAGDLVAQQLELAHQLLGEEALARGDDLAELDVRRAEVLGRVPEPLGQVGPAGRRVGVAVEAVAHEPRPERPHEPGGDPHEPGAGRKPAGRGEAGELGGHLLAQRRDVGAPGDGVEVEDPGRGVGERAPREVGRGALRVSHHRRIR